MRPVAVARGKIISSMVIFGTIGILVRHVSLPSSIIAMVRGFVGMAFLLLVAAISRRGVDMGAVKREFLRLGVSGVMLGFNWILLFEAYRYTTVATATLCYYIAPVFVMVLSPFLFGEKLTRIRVGCILAALVGMVFVSGVMDGGGDLNLRGILFGLGAAALYAGVVLVNKGIRGISANDRTILQLGVAAVVLVPYNLLTVGGEILTFDGKTILLLLVAGIVHTGIAYALYFGSIEHLPAQTAALFSYIDPVVAIVLSALLLKEALGLWGVLGGVLVLGSTLLSELAPQSSSKARSPEAKEACPFSEK